MAKQLARQFVDFEYQLEECIGKFEREGIFPAER